MLGLQKKGHYGWKELLTGHWSFNARSWKRTVWLKRNFWLLGLEKGQESGSYVWIIFLNEDTMTQRNLHLRVLWCERNNMSQWKLWMWVLCFEKGQHGPEETMAADLCMKKDNMAQKELMTGHYCYSVRSWKRTKRSALVWKDTHEKGQYGPGEHMTQY